MKTPLVMGCFVLTWSSGFVGATWGAEVASASILLAWRYLAASLTLTLLIVIRFRAEVTVLTSAEIMRSLVTGLLSQALFLGGIFSAAEAGLNAGISALICSLQPVVVAWGARVIFGEELAHRTVFSLCVGLVGVAMCVGPLGSMGMGAVWLVVVSLLALSASALMERAWPTTVHLAVDLWVQTVAAMVVFVVWAALSDGLGVRMTPTFAGAIAWLVILSGFGGYATFAACLRRIDPVKTSLLLYLTPAVTLGWAWLMFGQTPTAWQLIGCVIVVLGVFATRKA